MKYQYKVKNFRVFDEDGVKLDMAPITILTGCNSSGKSSFVKSMILVNSVLKELSREGKLRTGVKIDFTEKPNNLLGTFDNVIHRGSNSKIITVEYTIPSLLLNEDVVVSMAFKRDRKLNGGVLSEIIVSRLNGDILFQCKSEDDDRIYNVLCCQDMREAFFTYAFAVNNKLIIDDMNDGILENYFEQKEDKDYINTIRKVIETIKPYYLSHKDWIDQILSKFAPHSSKIESHSLKRTEISLTDEQIFEKSIYYNSNLNSLFEARKENFESVAKTIAEEGRDLSYYEVAISYIESVAKGFNNSEFEKFFDYCNHLYNEFFCNDIDIYDHVNQRTYESLSGIDRLMGQAISSDVLSNVCGEDALGDLNNMLKLLDGLRNSMTFSELYNLKQLNWYIAYMDYINLVIKEILSHRIPTEISYIPTSIVNIKRLYSFDEKDDMTKLLKDYILSEPEHPEDGSWGFASRWLKKLNIGKKVSVKALADGAGCEVRIFKENDENGQLLADFGYGVSQLIFLLLRIEIEANRYHPIMNGTSDIDYEEKDEHNFRLKFEKPLTIVLEEPEVHLHPKFQSMLADILLDAYKHFNFHFIIETHSEYLIRKTQVLVAQMGFENNVESVEKSPFVTYYIPENAKPYSLGYRKDGKFMESFGSGFYDEASNLVFELL